MKKLFAVLFAAFLFFSCSNNSAMLEGNWKNTIKLKDDLYTNPQDIDSYYASMFYTRKTGWTFNADGTFEKSLEHEVSKIEYSEEIENKLDLSKYEPWDYIAKGKYSAGKSKLKLSFELITVISKDGTKTGYRVQELMDQNLVVEAPEQEIEYKVTEDGIELYDAPTATFLSYKK